MNSPLPKYRHRPLSGLQWTNIGRARLCYLHPTHPLSHPFRCPFLARCTLVYALPVMHPADQSSGCWNSCVVWNEQQYSKYGGINHQSPQGLPPLSPALSPAIVKPSNAPDKCCHVLTNAADNTYIPRSESLQSSCRLMLRHQ